MAKKWRLKAIYEAALGDNFVEVHPNRRHRKKLQMQGAQMPAFNRQVEE